RGRTGTGGGALSSARRGRDRALPSHRAALRLRRQRQVRDAGHRAARRDRFRRPDRAGRPAADPHLPAAACRRSRPARPMKGRLLLVPSTLDFGVAAEVPAPLGEVLPMAAIRTAASLRCWVAENAKTTRAFLKRVDAVVP